MKAILSRLSLNLCLLLAASIISTVCVSAEPTFQEGPDAEVTFDGLVRIDNTSFKRVWADPEADLTYYTKIQPKKAVIEFRTVKKSSGRSTKSEFPIEEENRIKIVDTVAEVLDEEISGNKRFEITDKPGPDTLIMAVSLLDIVSRVPPQRAGRNEVFLSRVGEITIVIELKDSLSGETLLRAAERRALEPPGNRGMISNPATTMRELRRLARRWGIKINDGLESL